MHSSSKANNGLFSVRGKDVFIVIDLGILNIIVKFKVLGDKIHFFITDLVNSIYSSTYLPRGFIHKLDATSSRSLL